MHPAPTELRLLADHFDSLAIPCEIRSPAERGEDFDARLFLTLEQAFDGHDVEIELVLLESLDNADPDDEDALPISVLRLAATIPYDWTSASLPVMVGILDILNSLLPFGAFTLHPAEFGLTISHTHAAGASAFDTNPVARILDTWSFYFPIAARPLRHAATGSMGLEEIRSDLALFLEEIDRDEEES